MLFVMMKDDGLTLHEQLSEGYDCAHCHLTLKSLSWRILCNFMEKFPSVFGGHLMPRALPWVKPMCVGHFQSVGLALASSSSSVHYLGNAPSLGIYPKLSIQKGSGKMNYYELFLECCYVKFLFCSSLFFSFL